jgi:hypothetical protein
MNTRFYDTDVTDAAWAWVGPVLPAARPVGRPRTTNLRAVLNAIFYLLRTGCQCDYCHANFRLGARSTITFEPGKTPVCGPIYIGCSTSRPVVMPDEKPVLRW